MSLRRTTSDHNLSHILAPRESELGIPSPLPATGTKRRTSSENPRVGHDAQPMTKRLERADTMPSRAPLDIDTNIDTLLAQKELTKEDLYEIRNFFVHCITNQEEKALIIIGLLRLKQAKEPNVRQLAPLRNARCESAPITQLLQALRREHIPSASREGLFLLASKLLFSGRPGKRFDRGVIAQELLNYLRAKENRIDAKEERRAVIRRENLRLHPEDDEDTLELEEDTEPDDEPTPSE